MIRIVLFGSSAFGLPSFMALARWPTVEIAAVVSQPDRPVGRGGRSQPTPISAWAKGESLPLLVSATLKDLSAVERLGRLGADMFLVAAYGLILPADVLRLPRRFAVNIHASLLPRHRGASPVAAAILAGDAQTGVSLMVMDEGIDTGPVIATHAAAIRPDDTTPELERRLAELAGQTIVNDLTDFLAGRRTPQPQPATGATYARRLKKDDGRAAWDSGQRLERMIRAYAPWPGVWTTWRDRTIKILQASFQPESVAASPGTVVVVTSPPGWAIACADGLLRPQRIQFAGRRPQAAASVPGSYPGFVGSRLS